ncbi:TetR/AcrR family transcriptional regulator [Roseateles koreensis]|uniref:TetR/AcrR family transcriptional regulator n=1 Tax=Roseateles koreensis TaxID=2987526 RepID=A0ABT5KLR4_9BURK|nr:TetR/AcrR family transcriptional regulator [Roseateles koreensis]MDC8783838.1 TetR/AcrR family transcriptional regulator [Roseateles koreensis]
MSLNPLSNKVSSSRAGTRQRRKEARPQELLDAALTLFVERGFAATRSEEVAARAGVSKGTLYRYYPSKEDLFKAVVRENLSVHIEDSAVQVANFTGSSVDLLRQVMNDWLCEVGDRNLGGICKIMLAEAGNFPELAQFYMTEVIAPTNDLLCALIRRGIERGEFREVPVAETVTVLIGPMLHMVLFEHAFGACKIQEVQIDPASVMAVHLDLLLRGLLSSPVAPTTDLAAPSPSLSSRS